MHVPNAFKIYPNMHNFKGLWIIVNIFITVKLQNYMPYLQMFIYEFGVIFVFLITHMFIITALKSMRAFQFLVTL